MTFLELCQAVRREAGVAGTGPATVVGQSGMYGHIVHWVNRAWLEIQRSKQGQWRFMTSCLIAKQLVPGAMIYAPASFGITDHRAWLFDDMRLYKISEGQASQRPLVHMPYPDFRDAHNVSAKTTASDVACGDPLIEEALKVYILAESSTLDFTCSQPTLAGGNTAAPYYVTEAPNRQLLFAPIPDADDYTFVFRYRKRPGELAGNDAVPSMPAHFHEAIVQKALTYYAAFDNAPEVYADSNARFAEIFFDLMTEELPPVEMGYEAIA